MLAILLPIALKIVAAYGLPALEARFPKLAPILEEILKVLAGSTPSTSVVKTADFHDSLISANDLKS